jgi:acyl carrier protein
MACTHRTELLLAFRRAATQVAEKDFSRVVEATRISELGIDSLGMLEITGSFERELRVQIPSDALTGVQTIRDLRNAVESQKGA